MQAGKSPMKLKRFLYAARDAQHMSRTTVNKWNPCSIQHGSCTYEFLFVETLDKDFRT